MSTIKIVATIGPATSSVAGVKALVEAGMNMARLNGAHADLDWHGAAIAMLREVAPHVPILFDLPGRKIRVAKLSHEPRFTAGDHITLTTDGSHDGREKIPVTHLSLHNDLKAGDVVLADDGTLRFIVAKVEKRDIICRAENAGMLKSGKGINLPGTALKTEIVSERDRRMLEFAWKAGVDFIGVSFVESAAHVKTVRDLVGKPCPRIIAKVENQNALNNLQEVVEAADAVMIDRGDLSSETTLEHIALLQKRVLRVAREAAKPAIVATEMLHSMIENPFPSKAEVTDISNAVLDGASALMLSGETAVGRFPSQAVALMRRVADAVALDLQGALDRENGGSSSIPQAMGEAIALVSRKLPVTKIVAITISGYAARMVAARSPRQPILAVSNDPSVARSFNLLPGTEGICVDIAFSQTSTDHIAKCLEELWRSRKLTEDDLVLVTSVGYPRSGNRMNLIQMHRVGDLKESLRWTR